MPNPGCPPWELLAALDAYEAHETKLAAAKSLGIPVQTFDNRLARAQEAGRHTLEAAVAGAADSVEDLTHWWKIVKDDQGNGYSLFFKNPATGAEANLSDMVRRAITDALADGQPQYEPRDDVGGEHLLVVDLADLHFLKLCVAEETGYTYNRDVARTRVMEGTKALLRAASAFGIARILFVLGNDALHVDNARKTTTSGTPQDTDGSIFQGFRDAFSCLKDAIEECAKVADVDLVHCMSNHDWITGWALSQALGGYFEGHPNVNATPYALSEMHRKYYRFGTNLIGLTHGDGAKEEKLYALTVKEARQHVAECMHIYWLVHHVHHKDRKRRGVDVFQTEKDHIGMTVLSSGAPSPEGAEIVVESVRSPSPPDGWHDRQGFINRQAVECFLYHATDGQKARFTEWF